MPPKGADEVSPRSGVKRPRPARSRRRGYFAPRRELLLSAVIKVAKSTGRNYVSALPQRATVGCDFPHLLTGITFHHRCQSKGLCLHSFPLPLPVTTAKTFVLPCRRLRNNYILCPTGTPTFAALRRQRRDLIIATRPAHQPLSSLLSAAAAQEVQAIPEPTMLPTALHARVHTAKSA